MFPLVAFALLVTVKASLDCIPLDPSTTAEWCDETCNRVPSLCPENLCGCTEAISNSAEKQDPCSFSLEITVPAPSCCGARRLCATTRPIGLENFSYSWSTGATTQCISVSPTTHTIYTVSVSNSCSTKTATAPLSPSRASPPQTLLMYNVFTPNGDGMNDVWVIPAITSTTQSGFCSTTPADYLDGLTGSCLPCGTNGNCPSGRTCVLPPTTAPLCNPGWSCASGICPDTPYRPYQACSARAQIFDRSGKLLFDRTFGHNELVSWDGVYQGQIVWNDVYMARIDMSYCGETRTHRVSITTTGAKGRNGDSCGSNSDCQCNSCYRKHWYSLSKRCCP